MERTEIRETAPGDLSFIEELYPRAFPEEDLLPLVRELLQEAATLSLIGVRDSSPAGHALFTICSVEGSAGKVALLGPLAVDPGRQGRGIGSAIVSDGLRRLGDAGVSRVFVLGDPSYYGRFGFESEACVSPPYALPAEWLGAWQSMALRGAAEPGSGRLSVPRPWRRPRLWAP